MSIIVVNFLVSLSSLNMLHKYNEPLFFLLPCQVLYLLSLGFCYAKSVITYLSSLCNILRCNYLQGPVVRTPVSSNPGLKIIEGFFFVCSKALSKIIFYIPFRVSNHQTVGKEN